MYKILLLIIPLLFGCIRKYECDVGTISPDGEFQSIGGSEGSVASSTPDWWDFRYTKEDAKENCESAYNDSDNTGTYFHCLCEKAN